MAASENQAQDVDIIALAFYSERLHRRRPTSTHAFGKLSTRSVNILWFQKVDFPFKEITDQFSDASFRGYFAENQFLLVYNDNIANGIIPLPIIGPDIQFDDYQSGPIMFPSRELVIIRPDFSRKNLGS